MSSVLALAEDDLSDRIRQVIEWAQPDFTHVTVSGVRRVFGGNARLAWSFGLSWIEGETAHSMTCILMSKGDAGHVDSDAGSEFRFIQSLNRSGLPIPKALAFDAGGLISGNPAVIMEMLPGTADVVSFLSAKNATDARSVMTQLVEVTAQLHRFDGWPSALAEPVADDPVGAQIDYWRGLYKVKRTETYPLINAVFDWLELHRPAPALLSIVHGDLRPGNFLYDGGRLTAILDWEMAHIGDPAEDIAWIYRSLWSPASIMPLEEFLQRYNAAGSFNLSAAHVKFYQIFSELKFAVLSISASVSCRQGAAVNLRLLDRAAKIPAAMVRCFALIDELSEVDVND